MADFPPNPVDVELWLPSNILDEIVPATPRPEGDSHRAFINDNVAYPVEEVAIEKKDSATKALPDVVSNSEIKQQMCGSSLHGTKQNSKDGIGSESGPAFDRCASSDGVYLLASERTYDIWNSARSTQTQGSEKTGASLALSPEQQQSSWSLFATAPEMSAFLGNPGGTGFFLPRPTDPPKKPGETMGTRGFLAPKDGPKKKEKSAKKGDGSRKKCTKKKESSSRETSEDQDDREQLADDQLLLPEEWTY